MEIRLASKTEIPGMIDLLKQVGEVHHQIRPDLFRAGAQKYNEAALEELLQDPARPIFGAVGNGKLLGYCFCILEEVKDNPVLCDVKSLYIDDLCVDENCRGQGIGKVLYEAVLDMARSTGCYNVTLNVWSCNESAMAFYQKLGLRPQKVGMETIL